MKKIFINEHEFVLTETKEPLPRKTDLQLHSEPFFIFGFRTKKEMEVLVESIENVPQQKPFIVNMKSKEVESNFFSHYRLVIAAGGVVKNKSGKILMMLRKGKWDLPKGKIDKEETIREAAKREVMEETGVRKLKIVKPIKFMNGKQSCTYHTYMQDGKRVIKATYWFEMLADNSTPLVPQTEEGITEVGWFSKKEVKEHLKNTYRAIEWVIGEVSNGKALREA